MSDNFSSLLNYITQNDNHHRQTHNNHNKKNERERKRRKDRKKLDVYNYIYHYFPFMKHYFIDTCFLLAT